MQAAQERHSPPCRLQRLSRSICRAGVGLPNTISCVSHYNRSVIHANPCTFTSPTAQGQTRRRSPFRCSPIRSAVVGRLDLPQHCAISVLMLRTMIVSIAGVIALFGATVRLPASPCVITNTASEKPCAPGCCANKKCCATSHQRTGSAAQPFAKATSDQQNVATISASIPIALAIQPVAKSFAYSSRESAFIPAPRLTLLCTFLI